jgi:hypothetical protein
LLQQLCQNERFAGNILRGGWTLYLSARNKMSYVVMEKDVMPGVRADALLFRAEKRGIILQIRRMWSLSTDL